MSRFLSSDFLSRRSGAAVLLVAILALYFGLGLYHLGGRDLTYDELMSSRAARMPASELVAERLSAGHPPLYFLALKGWVGLTSQRPATMELFSVLLGVLGIPLMLALGGELKLGHWAWAGAALWAVQPSAAFFAREIRPYIGAGVLGAFILWSVLRSLHRGGVWPCLLAMAAAAVSAAWNLNLVWLWVGLLAGALLTDGIVRKARFGFWLALGFGLVTQLAGLFICLRHTGGGGPIEWIKPLTLSRLFSLALRFLGGQNLSFAHLSWRMLFPLFMAGAIVMEAQRWLVRLQSAGAEGPKQPDQDAMAWGLVTRATLLPILMMVVVSFAWKPVLLDRYLMALLPGLILLAAGQLARTKRARLAAVLCVGLVLLATANDRCITRHRDIGLRRCVKKLEAQYEPGDLVMTFHPTAQEALRLYSDKTYRSFAVEPATDPVAAWRIFDENVHDAKRLWVLAFWCKGGLMNTPRWKQMKKNFEGKYIHSKDDEAKLLWYKLPIQWQ